MSKLKPPHELTPQVMAIKTGTENMSSQERIAVFDAYEFSHRVKKYILKHPEKLTEEIIEKLIK